MSEGMQEVELIRRVSSHQGIDAAVLIELLALAPQFENFHVYGAKTQFAHAVAEILDKHAALQADGPTA